MQAPHEPHTPDESSRLLSREFLLLLAAVSFFGFSWSFYLILPKFFATQLDMDAVAIGRAVAIQGITAVAVFLLGKSEKADFRHAALAVLFALISSLFLRTRVAG